MRIVFMGTPAFAIPSLEVLMNAGHDIVGVITATDKLGGRGKNELIESAIKKYALEHDLNILQPKNLKSQEFQEELRALKAELQVVVAFRMLPIAVWDMPEHGTMNLHGSLLPKYRGAAPINWAIIKGEKETGVTAFRLKHEIDTGDIILQKSLPIEQNDTVGTVHDRMMYLGASVVDQAVKKIESGLVSFESQNDELACPAPKIFKEDCKINFDQDALHVHNFVRGMNPFPGAWTEILQGKVMKIFSGTPSREAHDENIGEIFSDNKNYLKVSCKDGYFEINELQIAGKRRMKVKEFLNGFTI